MKIPYGRQCLDETDVAAVVAALHSDFLTQGPRVAEFEQALVSITGAAGAVAVSNATAALHLCCLALKVGPGDLVWTTPNTFLASANCARYAGADVDFVDIDPQTLNMSSTHLAEKLAVAERNGRLPKAVVVVDFAGLPVDWNAVGELAKRYGFAVIEDASHALGASYRGEATGCGRHADLTVFSFHAVKLATTGEGGAIVSNNRQLLDRLAMLRTHGMVRDPARWQAHADEGAWYYEQQDLGYNYRITDLQCALGTTQLGKLGPYLQRRRELANRYDQLLKDLPVRLAPRAENCESGWHLYVIELLEHNRRQVFDAMRAAGIGVNVHYIPVHTQPYYRALGFDWGQFPAAEAYYRRALTLPLFPFMTDAEQDYVVATLKDHLR